MVTAAAVSLLLVAALGAVALKHDNDPSQTTTPILASQVPAVVTTTIPSCDDARPLVSALQSLDSKLAVGITYDEYRIANQAIQIAYDALDFKELASICIRSIGVPAEKALNLYRQALIAWKACLDDVQRCPVNTSKAERQRLWSEAGDHLAEAKGGLQRV